MYLSYFSAYFIHYVETDAVTWRYFPELQGLSQQNVTAMYNSAKYKQVLRICTPLNYSTVRG